MEARRPALCCLLSLLPLAGCQWLTLPSGPTARPESPATVFEPAVQVADPVPATGAESPAAEAPATEASESELDHVQRWAEQIQRRDDLRARLDAMARPPRPLAARTPPGLAPAADHPPAGSPEIKVSEEAAPPADPPPAATRNPEPEEAAAAQPAELPPLIQDITVRPEPEPPAPAVPSDPAPGVNVAQDSRAPLTSVRELLDHRPAPAEAAGFTEHLDHRLLAALAGDYERAREPIPIATREQRAMASHLIETVIAVREGRGGDPAMEIQRVLRELDSLYLALVPAADLSLPTLVICRSVRGFGQYEAIEQPTFAAGAPIEFVTYCEVRDFAAEQRDNGDYVSRFSMTTTVLTAAGDTVLQIDDTEIVDRCRSRRRDCFIPRLVRLPATLSPGQYVVKVTLADKIAGKVAEARTTFRVAARS